MKRIKYLLKQTLPLIYISEYGVKEDKGLCIWRMWLGYSWSIKHYQIK